MKIKIFATTDIHGNVYPYDYAKDCATQTSSANIYTCYKHLKDKNSIFVDNGDFIQGNFVEKFVSESYPPAIQVMNAMKYDIWNIGNHEFNFGIRKLKSMVSYFNGKTVLANCNDKFFKPYTIIEKSGIKIAFIGISTLLVNTFESEANLNGFKITDPVDVLDKILLKLHKEVDCICGLFHLGLQDENSVDHAGIYSILNDLKYSCYLDLIIAGHTHVEIEHLKYNEVTILEPGVYGSVLGLCELEFEDKKLVNISTSLIDCSNCEPDENILKVFEPYHNRLLDFSHQIIGNIKNSNGIYDYDFEDGPLVHLITEIMLSYNNPDVVAFQLDNEHAQLKNGKLTRSEMANLYTYSGGEVTIYKMSGKDLKTYMNWSYDYFEYDFENKVLSTNKSRSSYKYKTLDIFGNIKYTINYLKENKIQEIKYLNGKDILDNDILTVGMNEYRMNFLISDKGPLKGKTFEKICSSKYVTEDNIKSGTIRELAEIFFENLDENTFIYDGKINFQVKK